MLSETLLPSSLSQKKLEGEMVKSMAFRSGEFLADCRAINFFLLVCLLLYICYSINNNIILLLSYYITSS